MAGIKKGKDIVVGGWNDLIVKHTTIKPKGYSTAHEISKKIGVTATTVRFRLKNLRENNKIKCMKIRDENGKTVWVYKD